MKPVKSDPEERLPNLVQDPERYGYPNLMVNLPQYCCPHCNEYTVFSVTSPKPSPFPDAIREEFDKLMVQRSPYEQGVSDFACRVCSRPVRVVFRYYEFHMASFYYFAETVIEAAA